MIQTWKLLCIMMGVEKEKLVTLDHDEIINIVAQIIYCIKASFFLSCITINYVYNYY